MIDDEIDRLLLQRPIPVEEIVTFIMKAALLVEDADFQIIERLAYLNDVYDQVVANPAMAALPAWAEMGIECLGAMAIDGPHSMTAFAVLAAVSLGRVPTSADVHFLRDHWDSLRKYALPGGIVVYAQRRLREIMLDQLTDPYMKSRLLRDISMQVMFPADNEAQAERLDFLTDILIDSHMVLNRSILYQFGSLLDSCPDKEEELHQFLLKHPVLLDPFVSELRTKHELGDDFITDFIIRRTNDDYVIVEIENSTDNLFNMNGAFSAGLMAAVGQVRDFQAWISDNIAYAQTKLPCIRHPEGLVVIGRRIGWSPEMERRLNEENFSRRGHIRIVTYDDLLNQARSVYRNSVERPIVLRARDQKTI